MGNARARGTLAERIAQAKARPAVERPATGDNGHVILGAIEQSIVIDDKGEHFVRTRRHKSGVYTSRDNRKYTYDGVCVRRVR